ncbi:MAG: hypothetical protein AAGA48_36985 [Myxococcota bacterium]
MRWTLMTMLWTGCSMFGASPEVAPEPVLSMQRIEEALPSHEGKVVVVNGLYRAASVADEWTRIILIDDADAPKSKLSCFTPNAPAFQGTASKSPVTVRGTVAQRYEEWVLKDCVRVVE